MKKRSCDEPRVTRGFVGLFVRSRDRFMNIRLVLMDSIKRLAARRRSLRGAEKRTYVFILVPFNFPGNGHVRSVELEQDLIGYGGHAHDPRTPPFSTLAVLNRSASRTVAERGLNNPRELNHDLMWTWFLPNPLWPPNESNWGLTNLFRFGLIGFNPNKTRRNN